MLSALLYSSAADMIDLGRFQGIHVAASVIFFALLICLGRMLSRLHPLTFSEAEQIVLVFDH